MKAFPPALRRLEEVLKTNKQTNKQRVVHEIIPRFGLSRSLQSDSGTSFTSKVTQGVSKALGITYYLHCAWRPQSLGKGERANQFLKLVIKKMTQERPFWDGRRLYRQLSFTPVLPLRNRFVLVLMRCYMGDLLFMSMTSLSYTMVTGQFQ